MTVLDAIRSQATYLESKGVDSPRLATEWLLAHSLGVSRSDLHVNSGRSLTSAELGRLDALIERRARREPLQHILGSANFCGLAIEVNANVLVPRPETEMLAEWAWNFLKKRIDREAKPLAALDFGTGSGCLAIALAVQVPGAVIHALDVSLPALEVAHRNAERHVAPGTIQFHLSDGLAGLPRGLRFDLIVANPPYVAHDQIESLQPEVRDFDPHLALDGGLDGLDHYRLLAAAADSYLKPAGRLVMEFGDGQETCIQGLFSARGWQIEAIERDYSGKPRLLAVSPYCQ